MTCHCRNEAEHDARLAKDLGALGLSALDARDLKVIADAREYLRLHFRDRRQGRDRRYDTPATDQLPYYILDKIERWAG